MADTGLETMSPHPQIYPVERSPRARLSVVTPAVLRFQNGQRSAGNLRVVSMNGGLLALPTPLMQGSQVKLMFLTGAGSVLGGAEMLTPVSRTLQPFRFVSLASDDERRLGASIQAVLREESREPQWVAKLRAASTEENTSRGKRFKLLTMGLLTTGLAGAYYLFHLQSLR